ncbi:GTP-binding protein [Hominiventricola filiformis]|uniref:GTPase (G3E family) n=1 Tax=Hominiventricola filiformis TaxID=2885352 RepID=A0AAE3AAQ1_9FIRM|nr:GTP-binding protein [Hominiventricola filiformis]MCC2126360.1 GTPase (G3E family) [Hominiventricola filiformis]QUO22661.1 GTPase (G3E family) [Clostridiaceae bacterium Marseille-Q4143]RHU81741.1 GTPase (G3E family) [Clostridiaceae bacterium OM08-6BH]
MVKIDLITGFLGSGKTTFIKKYARYLLDQGLNIGILENDFGAVNVDMMLLKDLEGDHCELEMVSGGCDADCHRRRFKTKLIAMGMCGYDRVIVEPSGIFDMDEFFDILREEPLDQWYEIGSVIAVVDAGLDCGQSEAADYLLASEAAGAGCIVLSKVKNVSAEQTEAVKAHLEQAMKKVGCRRSLFGHIIASDWEQFTEEDYQRLMNCGYEPASYRKTDAAAAFDSLFFMNLELTAEELKERTARLFEEPGCGHILRVKGFVKAEDGRWLELNATRREQTLAVSPDGQEVLIVIGEQLSKETIGRILKGKN